MNLLFSLLYLAARNHRAANAQAITGFQLIAAPSGSLISNLVNGAVVYLNNTNPGLTVVALTSGRTRSVKMDLLVNGKSKNLRKTERGAPYALCGGNNYNACPDLVPVAGNNYTVTATPRRWFRRGREVKVTFELVAGFVPTKTPIKAPTNAPVKAPSKVPVVAPVPVSVPVVAPAVITAPMTAPVSAPAVADAPVVPKAVPVLAPMSPPVLVASPVTALINAPPVTPMDAPVVAPKAAPIVSPMATPQAAPIGATPVVAPVVPLLPTPVVAPVSPPVQAPVIAPVAPVAAPVAPPVYSISTVSAYTSPTGVVWEVDTPYVTGGATTTFSTSNAIDNTDNDGLYQKERWLDTMKYAIPIDNGRYEVILHTAELYSADNIRVFLALFEKGTANAVTGEINIFDAVGYMNINTANPESFFVTVSDNVLNLEFANVFSDPQLCGIEIKRAPALAPAAPTAVPPPAPARYRLSSGYSYTATNGDYWEPDTPYVTGGVVSPRPASTAIADTLEDGLYRKERWGTAMKYKLPIKNGAYLVTMHVAELAFALNNRAYNVIFEKGTANAITGKIDIFGAIGTGAIYTAYAAPFSVTVTDGELNIEFDSISSDPSVCGIEIVAAAPASPIAPNAPVVAPVAPMASPAAPTAVAAPVYSISTVSAYTSPTGKVWEVDTPYVTGGATTTFSASNAIKNTVNDGLYRKERWLDTMKYAIPIDNGRYEVILHTAELYSADNIRVFLALFEKGTANAVTGEINIFDAVGSMNSNAASPESFFVTVSDNVLNLEFVNVFSDPQLCGIEIKKASALAPAAPTAAPPPAPALYRLSAGYSYTATNGDYWEPDTPYATAGVVSPLPASTAIADTLEDGLYRKERVGTAMKYKLPIKNGAYVVTMHVAELASALNFRVYNVIFEKGTANAVIDQINIFKAIGSGAIFTAYAAPFNVTVSDGELNIEFVAIQSDPSVCGIEIVPKAG